MKTFIVNCPRGRGLIIVDDARIIKQAGYLWRGYVGESVNTLLKELYKQYETKPYGIVSTIVTIQEIKHDGDIVIPITSFDETA